MSAPIDLSGRRFGRLTALRLDPEPYVSPSGNKARRWICLCDCGKETSVVQSSLLSKRQPTRSCGCLRREKATAAAEDLSGMRFGRWQVLRREELARPLSNGSVRGWLCRCDCGTERVIDRMSLLSGRSTSCGCAGSEKASMRASTWGGNVFGRYEGTTISAIQPGLKPLPSSRSGVRGVCWEKETQRWVAMIGFKGKIIKLGRFADKDAAIRARRAGEEKYYAPVIAAYEAQLRNTAENL